MRGLWLAAVGLLASGAAFGQTPPTSPFPDGPGREIVAVACVACHGVPAIAQMRMNEQGWRRQVFNMILRGAQVGPGDIDAVSSYLAANFGPGVPIPGQPRPNVTLPDGPGANLVAGGCGICHGLDRVVAANRPARQWEPIVHRMVKIGAPLDAGQTATVISYLQAHYAGTPPPRR